MEPQLESEPSALRHNVITIDRPDSAQLVDLHVYIIPGTVWQAQKNLAENDAIEQAISVGFVRVPQDLNIYELRRHIQDVCGQEEGFPKDFIYLRSVGRCLAKVRSHQETELRVKNYRPPITFSPEIYILEGHHDDDSSLAGKTGSALSRESPVRSPSSSSSTDPAGRRGSWAKSHAEPSSPVSASNRPFARSGGERQNSVFLHGSATSSTSTLSRGSSTLSARDLAKLREEQERLRLRQLELARQRREIEELQQKRGVSESDAEEAKPVVKPNDQPTRDTKPDEQERRRREVELEEQKAAKTREEQKRQAEEEQRKQREQDLLAQSKAQRDREEQEAAALRIQSSYRGFQARRKLRDDKQRQHDAHELERLQKEARELARRKAEEDHAAEIEAHEVVKLAERLNAVRTQRKELENRREAIVRRMQQLHAQIGVRRTEERDQWKQKYQNEKTKTAELEEKQRTTSEDQSDVTPRIEEAKLRLDNTTKLRQQAESECQRLQQELQQIQQTMNSARQYPTAKTAQEQKIPVSFDITVKY